MELTIGELRKITEGMPLDSPVGVLNHYGELIQMDVKPEVKMITNHRDSTKLTLIFECPDIGEEPE